MDEMQEIERTRDRAIYWRRECLNCGHPVIFAMRGSIELHFWATLEVGEKKRVDPTRCSQCAVLQWRFISKSTDGRIVCAFPANQYVEVELERDFLAPLVGYFPRDDELGI